MGQYILETERLIIRELLPTDDEALFMLDADPEVHRYLGNNPVENIAQARSAIAFIRQQYIDYGIGRWAVLEKQSNNFIGWAGLKYIQGPVNGHTDFYDLGYRLIKAYWGRGYATESALACRDYGFHQLNLPRIYGMADVNNIGSKNVLEKAGFICEGDFLLEGTPHNWFVAYR